MVTLAAFSDVEAVLRELYGDLARVVTRTGTDLQQNLPTIRVRRLGGGGTRFTDTPRVDVQVFAATVVEAKGIAETCRQRLVSGPSRTSVGIVDRVEVEVGPREVPYADQDLRLVAATYRISLRRLL